LGAAADLVSQNNGGVNPITGLNNSHNDSGWVLGLYGSVQATDKLSFNVRGEYYDLSGSPTTGGPVYLGSDGKGEEVTATIQYNLWANVTSRLEFRWDHIDSGDAFANGGADADSFLLAANLIYTF
jgi:opacity protein-like surface antigen